MDWAWLSKLFALEFLTLTLVIAPAYAGAFFCAPGTGALLEVKVLP